LMQKWTIRLKTPICVYRRYCPFGCLYVLGCHHDVGGFSLLPKDGQRH
jgi:hypothetical protein